MAKYDLAWNEEKYNKKIKEGYGQGIGKNYKPWITIHDFPSDGLVSRGPGWKANRVFHFMSTNELRYFYLLEWCDDITDIREQFPLELEDTLRIAEKIGIKHPIDNTSKFPNVLTTDFMITLNFSGKEVHIARTIKPFKKLEENRVLEKFEIERRYWKERGIDWGIVTENDIPKVFAANIEWIHTEYSLEPTEELSVEEQLDICATLKDRLGKYDSFINRVTSNLDMELNIEKGTSLSLFRHLLARKEVIMNMLQKISGGSSTKDIVSVITHGNKVKAL